VGSSPSPARQYAITSIETAPVKLIDQSNAARRCSVTHASSAAQPVRQRRLLMKEGASPHASGLFTYVNRNAPALGAPVGSFSVNFGSGFATRISGRHDPRLAALDLRAPDMTAAGVRVAPTNVIVMSVKYYGGVGVEALRPDVGSDRSRSSPTDDCRRERGSDATSTFLRPIVPLGKVIALRPVRPGSNCSRWRDGERLRALVVRR